MRTPRLVQAISFLSEILIFCSHAKGFWRNLITVEEFIYSSLLISKGITETVLSEQKSFLWKLNKSTPSFCYGLNDISCLTIDTHCLFYQMCDRLNCNPWLHISCLSCTSQASLQSSMRFMDFFKHCFPLTTWHNDFPLPLNTRFSCHLISFTRLNMKTIPWNTRDAFSGIKSCHFLQFAVIIHHRWSPLIFSLSPAWRLSLKSFWNQNKPF